MLLAVLYVALWLALPSRNVHTDALDELTRIESPSILPSPKHPAAETSAWAMMQGLRGLGYAGNAIRPVQLWNATWMSVALLGAYLFVLRGGGSTALALGTVLVLSGCHTALHFALDPFLLYWPPGLALMTWALFAAAGKAQHVDQSSEIQRSSRSRCASPASPPVCSSSRG